jgi:hypothetical protein
MHQRHTILYVNGTVTRRPKAAQPRYLLSGARVWPEAAALGKLDKSLRDVQLMVEDRVLLN